jgi:hypothetical protein
MRLVISIMLGFLSICFNLAECCAASVSEIRAAIDGAYVLEEWYTADRVFRPPQVEGRVVFLNGAVVTILIDKMREERQTTVAEFGVYELGAGSFSYRYDNASIFTQTESAINVSHGLPWEGMRDFDITQEEGATVRLRSRSSEQAEFIFNADGIRYSMGGKLLRVWRRSRLQ